MMSGQDMGKGNIVIQSLNTSMSVVEKKYNSNKVSFELENMWVPKVDNWGSETASIDRFWSDWAIGNTIPVFIDPNDFKSSVVVNKVSSKRLSHYLALLVTGTILIVIWLFVATQLNLIVIFK